MSALASQRHTVCVRVCVSVLVLAVLSVVVVAAVTDVSVGRAGFPVALGLVFTGVQVTGVSAASPIVTWRRKSAKNVDFNKWRKEKIPVNI